MNAPLPPDLINITFNASQVTPSGSDPADILHERTHVLHSFWKVHAVKSRVSNDASAIRARDLFWRVWGDPHLSRTVTTQRLEYLWTRCQQDFDLSSFPLITNFALEVGSDHQSGDVSATDEGQFSPGRSASDPSISPSSEPAVSRRALDPNWVSLTAEIGGDSTNDQDLDTTDNTLRSSGSKNALNRSTGNTRKRTSFAAPNPRSKGRPQLGRRKSSQTSTVAQNPEVPKSPRPVLKSPRPSSFGFADIAEHPETVTRTIKPAPGLPLPSKITSTFELPQASSWQSEDSSHGDTVSGNRVTILEPPDLLVEKDFREKFVQTQRLARSSSNLTAMDRMKKTGSVVRFADDVEQEVRKGTRIGTTGTANENGDDGEDINSLRHRESISSVAAFSDDGSDTGIELRRVQSGISLGLSSIRKQSGTQELPPVPPVQKTRDAGSKKKKVAEDELLAMGRKDGVTKAGGVQVSRPKTFSSTPQEGYEMPEEPLY